MCTTTRSLHSYCKPHHMDRKCRCCEAQRKRHCNSMTNNKLLQERKLQYTVSMSESSTPLAAARGERPRRARRWLMRKAPPPP